MTSANVVLFRIKRGTEVVGKHRQNIMCKRNYAPLLAFAPPEDFTITPHGLDGDEAPWEGETMSLRDFLTEARVLKKS